MKSYEWQADGDVEFLELKNCHEKHDSLLSHGHSKQSTSEEDLWREWTLKVIAPSLHQYMLVLFDGDRPCSEVDKPVSVFPSSFLSPSGSTPVVC